MLLFLLGRVSFFLLLEDAENYQKGHPFHRPQFPSLSPMLFSLFIATGEFQEKGLHSSLVLPFSCFCHLKGNRRREGKEKERGEINGTQFLMGRAKKRIEKRDEQRRWRDKTRRKENGTLLYLSSLPSLSLPSFFSKQKNEKGRT